MPGESPQAVRERLLSLLKKAQGLPALPAVVSRINELVNDPKVAVEEVAKAISADPGISAKILRVVNSPFYGMSAQVSTIRHAAVILGSTTIRSIALSSSMFDVLKGGDQTEGFDRTEFWKHSIGCGSVAKVLGRRLKHPAPEELFMGGLLHDAGKILIEKFARRNFAEAVQSARTKGTLLVEAEREILGVTHAEAGALLFDTWRLSPQIVESTRCHHSPKDASHDRTFTGIIHVSDVLIRALRVGNGGDDKIPVLDEDVCRTIGVGPGDFDAIIKDAETEIEKSGVFLEFL